MAGAGKKKAPRCGPEAGKSGFFVAKRAASGAARGMTRLRIRAVR